LLGGEGWGAGGRRGVEMVALGLGRALVPIGVTVAWALAPVGGIDASGLGRALVPIGGIDTSTSRLGRARVPIDGIGAWGGARRGGMSVGCVCEWVLQKKMCWNVELSSGAGSQVII